MTGLCSGMSSDVDNFGGVRTHPKAFKLDWPLTDLITTTLFDVYRPSYKQTYESTSRNHMRTSDTAFES